MFFVNYYQDIQMLKLKDEYLQFTRKKLIYPNKDFEYKAKFRFICKIFKRSKSMRKIFPLRLAIISFVVFEKLLSNNSL